MGFNPEQNRENKIYISIVGGNLHQKVPEGTPGAVERKNKNDVMVHEIVYTNGYTGYLKSLLIKDDPTYGKQLEVVLFDDRDTVQIAIPVDSKYFDTFASTVGNVDFAKPFTFKPYSFEPKDGKPLPDGKIPKRIGVSITQESEKVKYYHTPEDPKGKPFTNYNEHFDKDEHKIFKIKERKFLCGYITELASSIPSWDVPPAAVPNKIQGNPNAATTGWDSSIPKSKAKKDESDEPFQVPDKDSGLPF